MKFYLKAWFIIILFLATVSLFFSILYLSEMTTELDLLAVAGSSKSQAKDESEMDLGKMGFSPKGPTRGSPQAKIRIVEFSDFQCPYCLEAFTILKQVWSVWGDDVYFQFRHFPIGGSLRSQGILAHEASLCANEQGNFWEYHDLIFQNQPHLNSYSYYDFAVQLGLDMKDFNHCLETYKYRSVIDGDIKEGLNLGVTATPTFFINGRRVQGVVPLEAWEKIISEKISNP